MTPGQRTLELIQEKHLNQRTVSKALGIPYTTLNGWKDDNRNPSCNYIIPICEYLGVTPQYLLTGEENVNADFTLSPDEKKLVAYYRQLPESMRLRLLGYAGGMCDTYMTTRNEKETVESVS